jgi:hypothetical protein
MVQKLPLTDFRAVRSKLEPDDFAVSKGPDAPPSDLVHPKVWHGIVHLPEDVSIRISHHNGARLQLLYQLRGDWIEAAGEPDSPGEMFGRLLEATDCFQGATFNFLHGFYRTALAELRKDMSDA